MNVRFAIPGIHPESMIQPRDNAPDAPTSRSQPLLIVLGP